MQEGSNEFGLTGLRVGAFESKRVGEWRDGCFESLSMTVREGSGFGVWMLGDRSWMMGCFGGFESGEFESLRD